MNFYTIVCILWLVVFILFMGTIGIIFSARNTKAAAYPGQRNQCPDFWTGDALGNCFFPTTSSFVDKTVKINAGNLTALAMNANTAPYSKDGKSFNVNDPHWASGGQSTVCAQRNWAILNRIVWDGVSNYNQCT
jgi:hypothetical protein